VDKPAGTEAKTISQHPPHRNRNKFKKQEFNQILDQPESN